jgi:hypothetical protein
MPPRKYEIYRERFPLGECEDFRFWLVVRDPSPCPGSSPPEMDVVVVPLSSQFDLYDDRVHFCIRRTDDGFSATGLSRDSYVIANKPTRVSVKMLRRRKGELIGDLLAEFKEWVGEG